MEATLPGGRRLLLPSSFRSKGAGDFCRRMHGMGASEQWACMHPGVGRKRTPRKLFYLPHWCGVFFFLLYSPFSFFSPPDSVLLGYSDSRWVTLACGNQILIPLCSNENRKRYGVVFFLSFPFFSLGNHNYLGCVWMAKN